MKSMRMKSQRGAGKVGAIVAIVLFAIVVIASLKIAPHFINHYELDDFCQTESRAFSYNQRSESEYRANIMRKIADLKIPVTANQLRISKNEVNGQVKLSISYTVRVEFPGYTFVKDFAVEADTRRL